VAVHSWMGVAYEVALARAGFNIFIHGADIIAMKEKLSAEIRELRAALGGSRTGAEQSAVNI